MIEENDLSSVERDNEDIVEKQQINKKRKCSSVEQDDNNEDIVEKQQMKRKCSSVERDDDNEDIVEKKQIINKKRKCPWDLDYSLKDGYSVDEENMDLEIFFPEIFEIHLKDKVGEPMLNFITRRVLKWYKTNVGEDWKEPLAHLFLFSEEAKKSGATYHYPIFWQTCFSLYREYLFTPAQQHDVAFLNRRAKDWNEFSSTTICPKRQKDLFTWSRECDWDKIKVVILGQDPYPNRNHAHGLAFSAKNCGEIPQSLDNILTRLLTEYRERYVDLQSRIDGKKIKTSHDAYSEMLGYGDGDTIKHFPDHANEDDFGTDMFLKIRMKKLKGGDLTSWADQGVLLLNTALTTQEKRPGIHADIWEYFTINVLRSLEKHPRFSKFIFMLWGTKARNSFENAYLVECKNLLSKDAVPTSFKNQGLGFDRRVIISTHPSPLSASRNTQNAKAFLSTNMFTKTNDLILMADKNAEPINWMSM